VTYEAQTNDQGNENLLNYSNFSDHKWKDRRKKVRSIITVKDGIITVKLR
jgi:hypothetical protein